MKDQTKKKILTLIGIGNISFASGTFASLFTCCFYFLLIIFKVNFLLPLTLFIILIPLSIFIINNNLNLFSEVDAKEIVVDEYLGQSIPIFYIYYLSNYSDNDLIESKTILQMLLISFLSFRFFDILKVFPINMIDKIKNGYGIVFDDILAGLYSLMVLFFAIKII